jgi:hypothetical protein
MKLLLAFIFLILEVKTLAMKHTWGRSRVVAGTIGIMVNLLPSPLPVPTLLAPAHAIESITSSTLSNKDRFATALSDLRQLDKDWGNIIVNNDDGDKIRRVLGNVYTPPTCTRALCGFDTFMRNYARQTDTDLDIEAYDEYSQVVSKGEQVSNTIPLHFLLPHSMQVQSHNFSSM